MGTTKSLLARLSLGTCFWLLLGAQGCKQQITETCDDCECEAEGCSTTTTGTGTTIQTSPDFGGVCYQACLCEAQACEGAGGVPACVASFEDMFSEAQETGCGAQFGAAFACYEENLTCVEGNIDIDVCKPAIEAFDECVSAAQNPNAGECQALMEKLVAKYTSCGIDVEIGDPPECTAEVLAQMSCVLPCTEDAPCSVFAGNASDEEIHAYTDCVSACSP